MTDMRRLDEREWGQQSSRAPPPLMASGRSQLHSSSRVGVDIDPPQWRLAGEVQMLHHEHLTGTAFEHPPSAYGYHLTNPVQPGHDQAAVGVKVPAGQGGEIGLPWPDRHLRTAAIGVDVEVGP